MVIVAQGEPVRTKMHNLIVCFPEPCSMKILFFHQEKLIYSLKKLILNYTTSIAT